MAQAWIINPTDSGRENPRRKRRKARAHHKRRASPVRRRRARRNPFVSHRRSHRRRRARRNPTLFGKQFFGLDLVKIGIGTVAGVGADFLGDQALNMLPATLDARTRSMLRDPVKAAAVIAVAMIAGKALGKGAGAAAGFGGGVLLAAQAVQEFVLPAMQPGTTTKGYLAPGMGGYVHAGALGGGEGWGADWRG